MRAGRIGSESESEDCDVTSEKEDGGEDAAAEQDTDEGEDHPNAHLRWTWSEL